MIVNQDRRGWLWVRGARREAGTEATALGRVGSRFRPRSGGVAWWRSCSRKRSTLSFARWRVMCLRARTPETCCCGT